MELKLKLVRIPLDGGEASVTLQEGQANMTIARCLELRTGEVVAVLSYLQLDARELERAKMGNSGILTPMGRA